ncbi:MAG: DHH family phosphoesterase [Armatimonadia bacterium]
MTKQLLPPPPELLALLQTRASFVIGLHKGPDGDALGAGLALYQALVAQGKQVQIVAPTDVARHYRWLPQADRLAQAIQGRPDVAIYVDCDGADRLGELQEAMNASEVVVQIDHHSGAAFGQVQYVDGSAAAAALLVRRLLRALGWDLTGDIATCLYTGTATDTGFFRFENTNEEAFAVAAEMVARGVVPSAVAALVSETRPLGRMKLTGRALQALQVADEGRIAWTVLRPQDYLETGSTVGDTEGIVDFLKQVEGQQVAVLVKAPGHEGQWQVSLRAPVVDVADIARGFGGGGHARAAGFDYEGELGDLLAKLLLTLKEALAKLVPRL